MNFFKRILKTIFPTSWAEANEWFNTIFLVGVILLVGLLVMALACLLTFAFVISVQWVVGPEHVDGVILGFVGLFWFCWIFGDTILERFKATK